MCARERVRVRARVHVSVLGEGQQCGGLCVCLYAQVCVCASVCECFGGGATVWRPVCMCA